MQIEYEAAYTRIDKDQIRDRLKKNGAKLRYKETLQKRVVFNLPKGDEKEGAWARVRDEGDKITMSVKQSVHGGKIEDQKEINLVINDFNNGIKLMEFLGCQRKAYQETKRELWTLDGTEVTIDEWPYLEPFIEIEGKSEDAVRKVSEKLGFDYSKAYFGPVGGIYAQKYDSAIDKINNSIPRITFEDANPFI